MARIMRAGSDRRAGQRGWEDEHVRSKPLLRVRKTGALLVAAVIAFVGTVPLAGAKWELTPVLLIPIAIFVWAWRAGGSGPGISPGG